MLKVLLLSFVGALVYTILTSGVGFLIAKSKKETDMIYYCKYCEKYSVAEGKIPSWVDFKSTYPR